MPVVRAQNLVTNIKVVTLSQTASIDWFLESGALWEARWGVGWWGVGPEGSVGHTASAFGGLRLSGHWWAGLSLARDRFGVLFACLELTFILFGGELNNSSKFVGVETYPQIFFKLDCRHFRLIFVLVWVLS